jgi:hypothetical protein
MRYQGGSAIPANSGSGPRFYKWSAPGGAFSIQISFDVIDRMSADIMKAFWSLPKRGVEIGGILLGTVSEGESVAIEEYEPVGCEHRRGPSYVLSEPDRRKLEKALRKARGGRQVIGFFRSHTRLGLYLDQDDMSVIESYFSNPNHVLLLVRPDASGAGTAGFFFWEEGDIHRQSTYREFPFSTEKLREPAEAPAPVPAPVLVKRPCAAEAPTRETPAPETPALKQPAPVAPPPEKPDPATSAAPVLVAGQAVPPANPSNPAGTEARETARRTEPRQWHIPRLVLAAAAAVAVFSAGVAEYHIVRSSVAAAPARSAPLLEVQQNGAYLMVNWDRDAPAVRDAARGVLSVTDGTYRRDLALDKQQLRSGSLAYLPLGNDVSFRLRLLGGKAAVNESLRVVTAETVAKAAPPLEAADPAPPKPEPKKRPKRTFFDDGL